MNFFFSQLAIGIPFFLVLLYLIKLPESVRWAWTVGKIDIANQVISKMSEINHVEIPEEFLLKQKPKIVAKNEAGMGSLIASVELRGMYNIHHEVTGPACMFFVKFLLSMIKV